MQNKFEKLVGQRVAVDWPASVTVGTLSRYDAGDKAIYFVNFTHPKSGREISVNCPPRFARDITPAGTMEDGDHIK